jgi:signal transduction histidine kinase
VPLALAAATGGLLGGFFGAWLDLRHDLRRKENYLAAQTEGMIDSMWDLQQRYDEVFKANIELEHRVAERTIALSDANSRLVDTNEKLERALESQRELDRLKTQFFDNVSHELRTPLTLILLSLDSIKNGRGELTPKVRHHLETMERSTIRLLRLINHLLDLAKLEAGKTRLRYESVQVADFLESIVVPFRVFAEQKKIRLALEGTCSSPILLDPEKAEAIFQNLISNALKFTPEGGTVRVRFREDPDRVAVEIYDTGVGMAAKDLPLIFDRFAQADSSGVRRFGGTGIGLALVKETVELHGGSISVNSELGVGSCFCVTLPKGASHVREDLRERRGTEIAQVRERRSDSLDPIASLRPKLAMESFEQNEPKSESAATEGAAARKKLLVVEDDASMRQFLVNILRERYQVIEAEDGQDGQNKARLKQPDLILSDVVMPLMSGLQLTRALKESPETADIPVILLTARGDAENVADGLSCGANDYLSKPFVPRELFARIETQLRLRDAALRLAETERLAVMGLLTTGFAHEVRNPLNGLLNSLEPIRSSLENEDEVESLDRKRAREEVAALLETIETCGQRIQHLSESLLSFARPSAKLGPVDIGHSLDATLKVLNWRMPPGIVIERQYKSADLVWGDEAALNQVWLNLIDNALRAMGNTGHLQLATERMDDELIVSIADSGGGIPRDALDRIFEPFFSTRPVGEGTGLGLALCQRIVLRHHGRISVNSDEGAGTRFRIALPLKAVASDASAVQKQSRSPAVSSNSQHEIG